MTSAAWALAPPEGYPLLAIDYTRRVEAAPLEPPAAMDAVEVAAHHFYSYFFTHRKNITHST